MLARFYQANELNLQTIAHTLEGQYRGQGYETQYLGDDNQSIVQLKKESTFRTILGLNKALGITLQRISGGVLVKVGGSDWMDQAVVGAVGLVAIPPLAITAAIGAIGQNQVIQQVMDSIDFLIRQQQPSVIYGPAPAGI